MSHSKVVIDFPGPQKSPSPLPPKAAPIHSGLRYFVKSSTDLNTIHGVIGDYRISSQCGEIVPVEATGELSGCYFWEPDTDLSQLHCGSLQDASAQRLSLQEYRIKGNHLVLNNATLNGPEVVMHRDESILTLSPHFDFSFSTDDDAAKLGVINLVEARRFITLENGDEVSLLDSRDEDAPVLYLENALDQEPVKILCEEQAQGVSQAHTYSIDVRQAIPDTVTGEAIASLTVLEQYTSYFMQHALPSDEQHIWTPVHAPISWGWSIRVGRRYDGEWAIVRRKLMLPTTGHDGLQLPLWHGNSMQCSTPLADKE